VSESTEESIALVRAGSLRVMLLDAKARRLRAALAVNLLRMESHLFDSMERSAARRFQAIRRRYRATADRLISRRIQSPV